MASSFSVLVASPRRLFPRHFRSSKFRNYRPNFYAPGWRSRSLWGNLVGASDRREQLDGSVFHAAAIVNRRYPFLHRQLISSFIADPFRVSLHHSLSFLVTFSELCQEADTKMTIESLSSKVDLSRAILFAKNKQSFALICKYYISWECNSYFRRFKHRKFNQKDSFRKSFSILTWLYINSRVFRKF